MCCLVTKENMYKKTIRISFMRFTIYYKMHTVSKAYSEQNVAISQRLNAHKQIKNILA